ncbi:MAG TPA: hypothetical protein VLD86_08090 [Ilumatobacteraceae bacterium]|nr:hypothetical protein [Ilumatobacteraceae bacterium]
MRKTLVVIVLVLASCGGAKASPSADSVPAVETTVAPPETASTSIVAQPTDDVQGAFPPRLALTTKDSEIVTFSPHADPVSTWGVVSPNGNVAATTLFADGKTTIRWHDLRTDAITAEVTIEGEFRPTAVEQSGKIVALIDPRDRSTTVVLATPDKGEMRRWTFSAVVVPEAFANAFTPEGNGLPIGVFVIEYLAADTYRVRVIDTATGDLGLPLNLRDKSQTVDEVMTAVSRTAVFEPSHQLLFTLYQDATEGGEDLGAFIHTLGLINGVWCLDVPPELGLADHPGALAVSPDGSRLYAASSVGGIGMFRIGDLTETSDAMPAARATAALGSKASRVAIGASADEVVVALDGAIYRLDPITLEVRESFDWDMSVEALTVLPDDSIVIAGTGRMTMVSPDQRLLAERPLPSLTEEVTRLAVVD